MSKYAIYIHGMGSGSKSGTSSAFLKYFKDYEWICPEVNEDPYESLQIIDEYIKVFSPEIIAGTSLGGLYTAFVNAPDSIKIVCNAAIEIEHVIRKVGYGKHTFFCEREDGRKEYELSETVVRRFSEFKKNHDISLGRINLGVYSKDDEFVGQVESRRNAKLLEKAGFSIIWSDKFGHRMNENVAKKIPGWIEELSK